MTDRERAIVMAHTGICMLTGDKFQIFHKYVEDLLGRPVQTISLGWLEDEIKRKSKADFLALCAQDVAESMVNDVLEEILVKLLVIREEINDFGYDDDAVRVYDAIVEIIKNAQMEVNNEV